MEQRRQPNTNLDCHLQGSRPSFSYPVKSSCMTEAIKCHSNSKN